MAISVKNISVIEMVHTFIYQKKTTHNPPPPHPF